MIGPGPDDEEFLLSEDYSLYQEDNDEEKEYNCFNVATFNHDTVKRKRGRPPKERGPRDITVKVRLNQMEYNTLNRIANKCDCSISDVLRIGMYLVDEHNPTQVYINAKYLRRVD